MREMTYMIFPKGKKRAEKKTTIDLKEKSKGMMEGTAGNESRKVSKN